MICPNCGAHMDGDARFCGTCGTVLPEHLGAHSKARKPEADAAALTPLSSPTPNADVPDGIDEMSVGADRAQATQVLQSRTQSGEPPAQRPDITYALGDIGATGAGHGGMRNDRASARPDATQTFEELGRTTTNPRAHAQTRYRSVSVLDAEREASRAAERKATRRHRKRMAAFLLIGIILVCAAGFGIFTWRMSMTPDLLQDQLLTDASRIELETAKLVDNTYTPKGKFKLQTTTVDIISDTQNAWEVALTRMRGGGITRSATATFTSDNDYYSVVQRYTMRYRLNDREAWEQDSVAEGSSEVTPKKPAETSMIIADLPDLIKSYDKGKASDFKGSNNELAGSTLSTNGGEVKATLTKKEDVFHTLKGEATVNTSWTDSKWVAKVTALTSENVETDLPLTADYFPDGAFRKWLGSNADTNGSRSLSADECSSVTSIKLGFLSGVKSLKGIEWFGELTELEASHNPISSVDLSSNPNLTTLVIADGSLTSLSVSSLDELTTLDVHGNGLTTLDLSGASSLENANVSKNKLATLGLAGGLKSLDCNNNKLTELDVSGCESLQTLKCRGNKIKSLDVSDCAATINVVHDAACKVTGRKHAAAQSSRSSNSSSSSNSHGQGREN